MSLKNSGTGSEFSIRTTYAEDLEDCTASIFWYAGTSNSPFIMHKWNVATTAGFGLYRSGTGTDFRANTSHLTGTPNSCTQSQTANAGVWNHGIIRRTSGDLDHFLNGSKATNTAGTAGTMGTAEFYVGNSIGGVNGWIGNVCLAGVWNIALSDDECAALAKGWNPRKIRPQSLKMFLPLIRSDLIHWGGGVIQDTSNYTADPTLQPALRGGW